MTGKTREDIFLEKLSRLLRENRAQDDRAQDGRVQKQNRAPARAEQKTTENRKHGDLRNQPHRREM